MKLLTAFVLVMSLAMPVFAAESEFAQVPVPTEFQSISGKMPAAPSWPLDSGCVSNQGAAPNAGLGVQGAYGPQGDCVAGSTSDPADLVGFAMALESCQDGWVMSTSVAFDLADQGDQWHLYLWRDLGGMPYDACGMECATAMNLSLSSAGPVWETHDWSPAACPCATYAGETLYVGAVYVNGSSPADWYVGYDDRVGGQSGRAFGNLSGAHGDWPDLNSYGYGFAWGVENVVDSDCGSVPVEASSWGAVKNLYR